MRREPRRSALDTKRLVMAVVLSVGLLFVWTRYFAPSNEEGASSRSGKVHKRKRKKGGKTGTHKSVGEKAQGKVRSESGGGARPLRQAERRPIQPEVMTRVEGRLYRADFSNYGGVLRSFVLLNPRFKERLAGASKVTQVNLVRSVRAENLPLKIQFPRSSFVLSEPQQWELVVPTKGEGWGKADRVVPDSNGVWRFGYRWKDESGKVEVVKEFLLEPDRRYSGDMVVEVRNLTDERLKERLSVLIPSMDFGEKGRSLFRPVSLQRKAVCRVNGDVKERTYGLITGRDSGGGCGGGGCSSFSCQRTPAKANVFAGKLGWGGIDEKYFLLAVVPVGFKASAQCRFSGRKSKRVRYAKRSKFLGKRKSKCTIS